MFLLFLLTEESWFGRQAFLAIRSLLLSRKPDSGSQPELKHVLCDSFHECSMVVAMNAMVLSFDVLGPAASDRDCRVRQ